MQLSQSCAHELDNKMRRGCFFASSFASDGRLCTNSTFHRFLMKLLRRLENSEEFKIVATEKGACGVESIMSKNFVN